MKRKHLTYLKKPLVISLIVLGIAIVTLAPGNSERIRAWQSPAGSVKVPILIYHSIRPFWKSDTDFIKKFVVPPSQFEKQLKHLKDNKYITISFDELVNYFSKNTPLPPKPVILTIDDGWENSYTNAFPLIKKYNDKATFFVVTNNLDHKNFLTWQEVKELDATGMTIGAHTKSHPYLKNITNPETLRDEIIGSKKIIEERLKKEARTFAEPYGYSNELIISIIKEAGFTAARTAVNGIYHTKDDLLNLKANDITNNFDEFVKLLNPDYKTTKNNSTSFFASFPFVAALFSGHIYFAENVGPIPDKQTAIEQLQSQIQDLQSQNDSLKSELRRLKIRIKFSRTLKKGMSGSDVKQIQEFLKLFPEVYPEDLETGYFGSATENAIKKFQKVYGIESTGIVGPQTRVKLREQIVKEIELREVKSENQVAMSSENPPIQGTASSTATSTPPELTDIETGLKTVDTTTTDVIIDTVPDLGDSPESDFYAFAPPAETTLTSPSPSLSLSLSPSSTSTSPLPTSSSPSATPISTPTQTLTPTLLISNLQVKDISDDNATIAWTTNISATGKVQYALKSPVGANNPLKASNAELATNHSIKISGLKHNTTYYYIAVSKDANSTSATSNEQSFTTNK